MGVLAILSSKGQLTIPKEIRDQLNLSEGTRFYLSVRNGEVVARPKNRRVADLAGILGKPSTGAGATLEDFEEAIGRAVAEDDQRIVREWNELHGKKR